LLLSAVPVAAQSFRAAPVPVRGAPSGISGAAFAAAALTPKLSVPLSLPMAAPGLVPTLTPSLALPTPVLSVAAPAAVAAAPAAMSAVPLPGADAAKPAELGRFSGEAAQALSENVTELGQGGGPSASPAAAGVTLDKLFSGAKAAANAAHSTPLRAGAAPERRLVNDEGVELYGRPPAYYLEARRLVDKYKDKIDLAESLDVMDDAYADAWTKLAAIEGLAAKGNISDHNTRLEGTLMWVDGVLEDRGRRTAVNTYRVYFHKAPNPQSEIEEGLRRADGYLKQVLVYMKQGGRAEQALGPLDEVVLAFETRGYAEIKAGLKAREREISKATKGRVRFAFVDELARVPKDAAATRTELNRLTKRYGTKVEGLAKITEGVVYSRYVGLLLELKTVEHFYNKGYEILQSGRDFFTEAGMYITELDTVVRDPRTGRVSVVEAKSARVNIPAEEALQEKVVRKLEVYAKHRALLEKTIGSKVSEIVFSFDAGMNTALVPFLTAKEAELSKRYGFTVKFLFLSSAPEGSHPMGRTSHRR